MTTKTFLFELLCEELPARYQQAMVDDLRNGFISACQKARLNGDEKAAKSFVTPRRLAIQLTLPTQQADETVELWGPPASVAFDAEGKPSKAAEAFAQKNGVALAELSKKSDGKIDKLYVKKELQGRDTRALLPELVSDAVKAINLAKPMRWGGEKHSFIRPVHSLVALFGDEVIDVELFGVKSGRTTMGHRFHAPQKFEIGNADHYAELLREKAFVMPSVDERRTVISHQVNQLTLANGGVSVFGKPGFDGESWDRLLDEVAGLVEWPVAVLGEFESRFLAVPQECLISTMRDNQRYFHIVDKDGKLQNKFIVIANIQSKNEKSIADGNAKVIRPRFADAEFFFNTDKKTKLHDRRVNLNNVVFQKELGSLGDKTNRVSDLAGRIAAELHVDEMRARRAGDMSKCDLLSLMVNEFPELQGIMGEYYAHHDGEDAEVAQAIREAYLPRFAGDELPQTNTGIALALADRLDTIVGIFGIGQAPTGAKDPFALRRAAIGVLRIMIEKQLPLDLKQMIAMAKEGLGARLSNKNVDADVLDFFNARLRANYQDNGITSEIITAVMAVDCTQPNDFEKRVKAVQHFSTLPESAALAAANKRVRNILAKSDVAEGDIAINEGALIEKPEQDLARALIAARKETLPLMIARDYTGVLVRLASLRTAVDNFFDNVMVNSPQDEIRRNRHALLKELQSLFSAVADISQLQG